MRTQTTVYCLFLVLSWLAGSGTMFSQVGVTQEAGSQLTHEETIAKALQDLVSGNVDTRVGSIMLLGKYKDTLALDGVVRGLSDKYVRVRRAALVSLIEIQTAMPPHAVEKILLLLNDEDTEIRRMVSSSLAMLVNIWNTYSRGSQLIPIRPSLPLPVRQRFVNAFLDGDAVVRRNMLSYYFFLGVRLPEANLIFLLEDEDDMVRLEALRLAIRITRFTTIMKQAERLSVDPLQSIRLLFANMLGNQRTAASIGWLERLLEDLDSEVVNEASLSLFRITPTPRVAQRLGEDVLAGKFNEEQGATFIQSLSILGEPVEQLVERFLESDKPTYRLKALPIFLSYADLKRDQFRIEAFADDKSDRVRMHVLNFLRARRDKVPLKLIQGLSYARDEKVRETALALTRYFMDEDAEPLLLDFLIDEQSRLRMLALDELVRRSYADIREILHLSIDDSDLLIQRRAVSHLIGLHDPEELNYLKGRAEENPKHPLSLYIKDQMLERLGLQL